MLAGDKGLLAMDESIPTCHKAVSLRLAFRKTEEAPPRLPRIDRDHARTGRGDQRAPFCSMRTIRQKTKAGQPFVECLKEQGIVPGIKVDEGAHALAAFSGGKKSPTASMGSAVVCKKYHQEGARFAKWRAVITIGEGHPDPAPAAN